MRNYQAFCCRETGASHKDGCCQDYAGFHSDDGSIRIAVVSDGHGDKSCFRSDVGSRFAVEVAISRMKSFAEEILRRGWKEYLLDEEEKQEVLMRQLKRSIVGAWHDLVRDHLRQNPLTPEDYAREHRHREDYKKGIHLTNIYGCTLIAAMFVEEVLVVLHVGDGRCVVIHDNGTVDQPVPWDKNCVGNRTTSMCHDSAAENCRHYIPRPEDPIAACFVTTDGIEDCFEVLPQVNGVNAYFSLLAVRIAREGIPAIEEQMKEELVFLTTNGSQDDMSFGALVDVDAIANMVQTLEPPFEMYQCIMRADRAQRKLGSMQRKMEILRKNVADAEQQLEAVRREYSAAEEAFRQARQDREECSVTASVYLDAPWEIQENPGENLGWNASQIRVKWDQFRTWLTGHVSRMEQKEADCEEYRAKTIQDCQDAEARLDRARKELEAFLQSRQGYLDQYRQAMERMEALRRKLTGEPEEVPGEQKQEEAPAVTEELSAAAEEQTQVPAEAEPAGEEEPEAEAEDTPVPEEWEPTAEESDWESPKAMLPEEKTEEAESPAENSGEEENPEQTD